MVGGGGCGQVGLWDSGGGRRTVTLAEGAPVASVAFSPDGQMLAAGDTGGHIGLWDTRSGRRPANLAESGPVYTVPVSPTRQTPAAGGAGEAGRWGTASRRPPRPRSRGRPS